MANTNQQLNKTNIQLDFEVLLLNAFVSNTYEDLVICLIEHYNIIKNLQQTCHSCDPSTNDTLDYWLRGLKNKEHILKQCTRRHMYSKKCRIYERQSLSLYCATMLKASTESVNNLILLRDAIKMQYLAVARDLHSPATIFF